MSLDKYRISESGYEMNFGPCIEYLYIKSEWYPNIQLGFLHSVARTNENGEDDCKSFKKKMNFIT